MAKKQTRRTVSLERRLYEAIHARINTLGVSAAEYISTLVRDDLLSNGIQPPGFHHAKKLAVLTGGVVVRIKHTFGPAPAVSLPYVVGLDDKYLRALEFTRARLRAGLSVKPRTGCWWCHEEFKSGEIPNEYKDKRVHGRCKREIARLPEGAAIPA